jgi:hypothetical protein
MNEKIEYFLKADPEHKKTRFLITSFTNWSKRIKERFQTLRITVISIGARLHSRNWKRYWRALSRLFKELDAMTSYINANKLTNKLGENTEYMKNELTNLIPLNL